MQALHHPARKQKVHQDEEWLSLCVIPSGLVGACYHGAPSLLPLLPQQCQHTPDNTPGMSGT